MPGVSFVPVTDDTDFAADFLWRIMEERSEPEEAHTNISHTALPTFKQHKEFVETPPFRLWFLIKHGDEYVGQIRATWRNEIGVSLLRRYRGRGIAARAVKFLMDSHSPMPEIKSHTRNGWIANINPKNERSIAMFEKLGFHHIQNTYIHGVEEK